MSKTRMILVVLLVCMCGVPAIAADPPGREKYLVMAKRYLFTQPNASAPPALIGDEEIGRLGGTVEYRSYDRLVVSLPRPAVEAVRRHGSVWYVQRAVKGPQPVVTPAAAVAGSPTQTALRAPGTALRPVTQATWNSWTYLYDGSGNVTNIGGPTDPVHNVYVYDSLSRIKQANLGTNTEIYTYDRFGNLTQRETNGTAFPVNIDPTNNRLIGATYDPAGNLATYGVESYAYDPFNMLRQSSSQGPQPDRYVYTAGDQRIGLWRGDYWLWSFRDASGKVIRQYESVHSRPNVIWRWVEDYVYRDGVLLGAERPAELGGRRHFHLDHLGTPRLITGENGLTVSQHDYFPFGNEITALRQETPNGFDREEPMKFTGHERDFTGGTMTENTNYLDYMHARSTNPGLGRFLSVDPVIDQRRAVRNPQMWNRYAYVINNPIRYTDPTGRELPYDPHLLTPPNETPGQAVMAGGAAGLFLGAMVLAPEIVPVIGALTTAFLSNPAAFTNAADALLSPSGSSGVPVVASEETAWRAVVAGSEKIAGFSIEGTKGLVGTTFNRNIFGLWADTKGATSIGGLFRAIEGEAREAGAKRISIVGSYIINPKLFNATIAERYGYTFRKINDETIVLWKDLTK